MGSYQVQQIGFYLDPKKLLVIENFYALNSCFLYINKYCCNIYTATVLINYIEFSAYVLCDCGYDVWLANVRGNTYSQCHKQYTTNDREFWDFR